MNRRDFIRSLFATSVAALVPWKLKARDTYPITYTVTDSNGERFTSETEWHISEQPLTFQHSATWEFPPLSVSENDRIFTMLLEEYQKLLIS